MAVTIKGFASDWSVPEPAKAALSTSFVRKAPEDTLRWWRAQVGGAVTSPADVVVVSDSTGEGAGAGSRANRWVDRLLASLRREYQPDGVKGGQGYVPIGYSGGTIPNQWTYTNDGVIASDTFARAGDLNASMPAFGPNAWGGGGGIYTLNGEDAVTTASGTGATAYLNTGSTADRTVEADMTLTPDTTSRVVYLLGMFKDASNFVQLKGVYSTTVSTWTIEERIAGATTTLATYATPPVPAGTAQVSFNLKLRIEGSAATATVSGQTLTATLTNKTAVTGSTTGFANGTPNARTHNFSVTSLTAGPVASPTLRSDYGLGNRAMYVGTGQSVGIASLAFTGTGLDLIFTGTATTGVATITVDGGTPVTFDTYRATEENGIAHQIRGLTSGSHTVTVGGSGLLILEGAMVYDGDETKGIRLWEAARSGVATGGLVGRKWDDTLSRRVVPDLAIIGLGLNDYNQDVAPATTKANLATIIGHIRSINPNASVVLHNSFERGDKTAPVYPWAEYLKVIDEVAAEHGALVVDLNARMLGWNKVPTALQSMWVSDKVHPSPQGNGVMKDAIYSVVKP